MNRVVLLATVAAAIALSNSSAQAQVLNSFVGTWSGETYAEIESGKREKVKCTAYNTMAGTDLKVVVRCAGTATSGAIRISALLSENRGAIRGSWQEARFNINGSLSGKVNGSVITGSIYSPNFNASVSIQRTGTGLRVKIEPSGKDLRISVEMS